MLWTSQQVLLVCLSISSILRGQTSYIIKANFLEIELEKVGFTSGLLHVKVKNFQVVYNTVFNSKEVMYSKNYSLGFDSEAKLHFTTERVLQLNEL